MKLAADWSALDAYGQGDAYAAVPKAGGGFGKAAALCIGSRQCQKARGQAGDKGVMCPSFRITQDDAHSTRSRAAVLRRALDGDLGPRAFAGPELADAMALCVACKGCKRECPNGVDMAALRAEALAQRWQATAPPWRTRFFATLPQQLPALRRLRPLLALRNRMPWVARLLQRATGINARRELPLPAPRAWAPPAVVDPTHAVVPVVPVGAAEVPAPPAPPREVVLLADCWTTHLEPAIGDAALQVMRAAGLRVHVLQGLCCGRPAWSAGFIDAARAQAQALAAALAPHLAAGRAVVGLEPSCLSMLRDEFQQLGLDPGVGSALGRQALQLEELLARELDGRHRPLPWRPLPATVHVHGHCHQKAFGTLKAVRKLLAQVPQLQVQWIESSCCGMAGSFGYEAEHDAASNAMAELALWPALRAAAPGDLVLASGTSCRAQIAYGTGRRALHLAQVLQQALPEGIAA